jgi:hypothetical protein
MNAGQNGEREKKEGDEPVEQRRALPKWCFSAASKKQATGAVDPVVRAFREIRSSSSTSK